MKLAKVAIFVLLVSIVPYISISTVFGCSLIAPEGGGDYEFRVTLNLTTSEGEFISTNANDTDLGADCSVDIKIETINTQTNQIALENSYYLISNQGLVEEGTLSSDFYELYFNNTYLTLESLNIQFSCYVSNRVSENISVKDRITTETYILETNFSSEFPLINVIKNDIPNTYSALRVSASSQMIYAISANETHNFIFIYSLSTMEYNLLRIIVNGGDPFNFDLKERDDDTGLIYIEEFANQTSIFYLLDFDGEILTHSSLFVNDDMVYS